MKLFAKLFKKETPRRSSFSRGKEDSFVKIGREQFKTLVKKGLLVPVVLL